MEYILNESYYKTTNNFKINNIKIDIDIPDIEYNNPIDKEFNTRIGLTFNKFDEYKLDKDLLFEYANNKGKVININTCDDGEYNIVLKSLDNTSCFSYIKINNNLSNKDVTINVINLLNSNSISFIAYDNNLTNQSNLTINHIDIGSSIKINNCYTELYDKSTNTINTLYIGIDNNKLDYNYHIKNIGENTIGTITTEGILNDKAYKQHKGIIDFVEGSKKSKGEELENCILLSDDAISKSAPLLMCHEEDVEGAHGVSTGKIDKDKLFYLMSRGYTEEESKKLIILANFNKIINNISNEDIKSDIYNFLDKII